ncbi:MAG: hypothetical protein JXR80_10190 [Deltaproteobacteria bacterium]|nr:hypothetical protein [Deltaproteobacteria bacterium]
MFVGFLWFGTLSALAAADDFDFNKISAAQERQILHPYLVSADDYRESQVEQRSFNLNELLRGDDVAAGATRQQDDYERRLLQLEQRVGQGFNSAGGHDVLRSKVGILFAAGFAPALSAEALLRTAPTVMAGQGFVYLEPAQLQTVLNNFRYRQALNNPQVIASFLSEYPGSRYLLFLEGSRLPQFLPGLVELSFFVVDGYTGSRYPLQHLREGVTAAWQIEQALGRCLYNALAFVKTISSRVKPQGKIFLTQGRMLYLNIGCLSGLKPGQELEVLAPGRMITDPRTGLPAGFIAGSPRGRIRVVKGFGYDLAEAQLVAGQAMMGDLVELR